MVFEKEKEKGILSDGKIVADIRWGIFVCKEVSEANVHAKKEELPFIFMIQAKSLPLGTFEVPFRFFFVLISMAQSSFACSAQPSVEVGLDMAQLQTKLKGLEKEIEIEEGILKGAEKMAKVGACSSFCSCWGCANLVPFFPDFLAQKGNAAAARRVAKEAGAAQAASFAGECPVSRGGQ